ncbi:MAG: SDR family NAD(P)-dependent oxidoreductase [Candidatus Dormibacteria bacterium]
MAEFDGKVAVVTGSAMGIGNACAAALVAEGARVALVDRDEAKLAEAVASLKSLGAVVSTHAADVSDRAAVEAATAAILAQHGHVDVLVNSAGIQRYGTVVTTAEALWDEVLAVNVKGMFLMAKYLVPSIEEQRGAVVNVASVQSLGARPGSVAYVTSKHAVLGLTRAMAFDHAPNVRVNCVAPGSVDTPMLRAAARDLSPDTDAVIEEWGGLHLLGRMARADEVAQVVVFLAGPRSSFVTGACYTVDGGVMAAIK